MLQGLLVGLFTAGGQEIPEVVVIRGAAGRARPLTTLVRARVNYMTTLRSCQTFAPRRKEGHGVHWNHGVNWSRGVHRTHGIHVVHAHLPAPRALALVVALASRPPLGGGATLANRGMAPATLPGRNILGAGHPRRLQRLRGPGHVQHGGPVGVQRGPVAVVAAAVVRGLSRKVGVGEGVRGVLGGRLCGALALARRLRRGFCGGSGRLWSSRWFSRCFHCSPGSWRLLLVISLCAGIFRQS
mmetsp:Transcript_99825/g.311721  ORF Transcript_99825/g.311721 Transcript_99825/m.311721 type:complete len:242 (-) Transcript_99825:248-973(-)